MKKFQALYQAMYDDLKDADMMLDYAEDIRDAHAEDKPLADEFAKYAKFRLEHFMNFHKLFDSEMGKKEQLDPKTVDGTLWAQTDKNMIEWYDCINKSLHNY